MSALLQIGEVARRLNLSVQTLYFYERIGLIPAPQRSTSGYRLFDTRDLERLRFITRVKALGLSLDEIKEMLVLYDGESLTCEAIHAKLVSKVQDLDRKIQRLQALRDELTPLIHQCQTYLDASRPSQDCAALQDLTTTNPEVSEA
ncbi:MAG: heavy metal-responsive transcriptional regulator [Coleofasciculaceae cyanobacterium RL_1_1]|nr:heavy metal-responsive transcriptional regulator [Coleofasciculaceae cyanobacterium RL_1_1]